MTTFDAEFEKAVREYKEHEGDNLDFYHPIVQEFRRVREAKFHAQPYNAACYKEAQNRRWLPRGRDRDKFDHSPVYQPVLDKIHEGDYHGAERLLKDAGILI